MLEYNVSGNGHGEERCRPESVLGDATHHERSRQKRGWKTKI